MLIKSKTQNAVIFNGVFHIHIFQPYLQCSSPRRRKIYWSPKLLPAPMQITEMMFEISCMVSNTEFIKSCLFIMTLGPDSYLLCQSAWGLLPPPTPTSLNILSAGFVSLTNTNRIDKSCDGLKHKPLGIHLQGVLVGSLDAVKHLVLVAVHCGILQIKQ